jgi:hypothetical protein
MDGDNPLGIPKNTHRTNRAERERNLLKPVYVTVKADRETNVQKPPPKEKKPRKGLTTRKPLGARRAFGGTVTLHDGRKALVRLQGRKNDQPKRYRAGTISAGKLLKKIGRRGRRLAFGDRKVGAKVRALACLCGCNQPSEWAHLRTRADESTRHEVHLSIPACMHLHHWLDQGKGTGVRPVLFEMAKAKGAPLEHDEVYPILSDNGFYTWLHDKTRI